MPRGVIFLGPSLVPRPELPAHLEYRPPAQRGDLLRAAHAGVKVIGLIDGVFGQSLAVTPAEVRETARRGARLFGGASMGALRACECPEAMTGVGEIWKRFVSGELADDDEVAVTFIPETYELVAYPLVQVREAARLAGERHPDARRELQRFVEKVRELPFAERTMANLQAIAISAGVPEGEGARATLKACLTDPRTDLKRIDALRVIEAVKGVI